MEHTDEFLTLFFNPPVDFVDLAFVKVGDTLLDALVSAHNLSGQFKIDGVLVEDLEDDVVGVFASVEKAHYDVFVFEAIDTVSDLIIE